MKPMCNIDDPSDYMLVLNEPNDVKLRGVRVYIAYTNNYLIRIFDLEKMPFRTLPVRA